MWCSDTACARFSDHYRTITTSVIGLPREVVVQRCRRADVDLVLARRRAVLPLDWPRSPTARGCSIPCIWASVSVHAALDDLVSPGPQAQAGESVANLAVRTLSGSSRAQTACFHELMLSRGYGEPDPRTTVGF